MKDHMNHHQKLDKRPRIGKFPPELAAIEFLQIPLPALQKAEGQVHLAALDERLVILLPIASFG
jgi:hypothetical protein